MFGKRMTLHVDATEALSTMHQNGISRLMVTDGKRLAGIVTLKDLLKFLSIKMDLEQEATAESKNVADSIRDM